MNYYDKDKKVKLSSNNNSNNQINSSNQIDSSNKIAKQCDNCSRIFEGEEDDNYCPSCDKNTETDFQRVRNYVQKNPGIDILSVSKATKVSASLIMRYVSQGKIDTKKR